MSKKFSQSLSQPVLLRPSALPPEIARKIATHLRITVFFESETEE